MAKNDLFKKDWVDLVFAGRNKEYGAYKLRLENPKTTVISLLSGLSLFALVFVGPAVISSFFEEEVFAGGVIEYDVPLDKPLVLEDLALPTELPVVEEEKPRIEEEPIHLEDHAPASVLDVEKFTSIEIVDATKVTEEIAKQVDLVDALVGSKTSKGNIEGTILIDEKPGTEVGGTGTKENKEEKNSIYMFTTEKAEPMEGMASFSQNFVSKFRELHVPANTSRVQVILSFVVEKDGSITDIKVLRDPGYGAGKEAVRVLKTMPKWKPARQDKSTVRSQFTLPITIQVQ